MTTEVIHIAQEGEDVAATGRAAHILMSGGLVAFPTETVYGLAARADDAAAVSRLRELKQRDKRGAFTVHIGARDEAQRFAPELSGLARRFMRKGWPGPLTLVLPVSDPKSTPVMADVNGSTASAIYYDNTIGLRFPDDPTASAMLRAVDAPVVATSANRAGGRPPHSAHDVLKELEGRFDLLLNGGETKYAKPSTIVRLTQTSYEVVREGVYDVGIVKRLSRLRLLLVCTGNTCRSPMAAGMTRLILAQHLGCPVDELSARGIEVESAGTAGGSGYAAPHAVSVMARRGIDLSGHASRALGREMILQADHILAMTAAHRAAILSMDPSAAERVVLVLGDADVDDPIGGTEEVYERCAADMERGLRTCLREVEV